MKQPSQSVLITGGAVRVGHNIALHLARAGWNVAIHYQRSHAQAQALVKELETLGVKAVAVCKDFSTEFNATALLRECTAALGTIHCLINNASVFQKDSLQTALTQVQFDQHMHINLLAPIKLIQAFVEQKNLHDASIINIGDGTHGWSLSSKYLTYALSKISLMQLAEMLALELAPHIRINTIAPGPTLAGELEDDAMFNRMKRRAPLNRLSNPSEICDTIDYLLRAKSVTGQTILLSGGLHCHRPIDL